MPEYKYIPRGKNVGQLRNYVFNKNTPPILEVEPGEKFVAETEDALNGILRKDPSKLYPRDAAPYSTHVPVWDNPLCGPIFVKGVEPGDVLVVSIEKIDKILTGVAGTSPGAHHFTGLRDWEECDEMYTGIIENVEGKGTWTYEKHTYTWDLKPFIGTIATAPEFEVLSGILTSFGSAPACGGNIDCQDIKEGTKLYLQSFNEGGLLFFGDVHASQGDGEVLGANEVAAEVTLSCDVVKNKHLNNVRLETPESLISVYCYRPMEEAVKQALKDLILWLEEDYKMSKREAYMLAGICPEFRIRVYQDCTGLGRLMITVGAELSKKMLPK
ncbi:acetamidase/formamidase family protein [Chloroflexota bacterium]